MADSAPRFEHREWLNAVYAGQFMRFLAAKGFTCATVLDVGAHKGEWSREFLRVFPRAAAVMIDPLEEVRPHLQEFCNAHAGSSFHIAGAGAAPGELEFTVWPGLGGSSFVPQRGHRVYDGHEKRIVPVLTLDGLVESGQLPIPELAKLDVQGFELEVLRGAKRLLGRTEVFFLEVSLYNPLGEQMPLFVDVIKFMHDQGYVVYDIPSFYRRRKDHALAQCDVAFVKADSRLRQSTGLIDNFDWNYSRFRPTLFERAAGFIRRRLRKLP